MSTLPPNPSSSDTPPTSGSGIERPGPVFVRSEPVRGETPWVAWGIAGAVVVLIVAAILIFTRHKAVAPGNTVLPAAGYAANLPIADIQMSESTSLSGGKSTYLDGHIRNSGGATVTGATVQVLFANDEGMPPQIETLPLSLIRTREPYVDIEPVSAAPIAPGEDREFRLIFEDVSENWNQQLPEIKVVKVATR